MVSKVDPSASVSLTWKLGQPVSWKLTWLNSALIWRQKYVKNKTIYYVSSRDLMFTLLNEYNLFFLSLPNCNPWNFLEFKSQQLKGETIFDFDLLVILLSFMHYWCWNWHWCWYTCNFDCLIFVWNTIYVCRRFLPLITFTFLSNWVNLLFNLVHRGQLCSCSSGRKTQDTRKNKDSCFLKTPFIHQRDLSPNLKPFQFKSHKEASISVRRDLSTMS